MNGDSTSRLTNYDKAFAIGIALNLSYVAAEAIFALLAHSLALLADAGHNLSDVLSLLLAWGASRLSKVPATKRYTYGLRSSSILASLANAIVLLIVIGAIAWEALRRFHHAELVPGGTIIAVAGFGVLVNTATALLFIRGSEHDLNLKAAFLHMTADAAVSLGVVFAGFAIKLTQLPWIDPLVSLIIVAVIALGTWGLLRDSMNLALQAVPARIDLDAVRQYLTALPRVSAVHDLHVWPMSTTETALTVHLEIPTGPPGDEFLCEVCEYLRDEFGIGHSTLQLEQDAKSCALAPDHKL
jgi:cobalt-zinc-cadmium efflux system protein